MISFGKPSVFRVSRLVALGLLAKSLQEDDAEFHQIPQRFQDAALDAIARPARIEVVGDLVDVRADLAELSAEAGEGLRSIRDGLPAIEEGAPQQSADGLSAGFGDTADRGGLLVIEAHGQYVSALPFFAAAASRHKASSPSDDTCDLVNGEFTAARPVTANKSGTGSKAAAAPGAVHGCESLVDGCRRESEVSLGLGVQGGHEGPHGRGSRG